MEQLFNIDVNQILIFIFCTEFDFCITLKQSGLKGNVIFNEGHITT